jgi:methenyltetrahydromethanopterin cyclohydrolase
VRWPPRKLYAELGYRDRAERGVLVLEVDRAPPPVVQKILRDCGLPPEGLTIVLTPTSSAAGTTQVVARVLEVALHKTHELGFRLDHRGRRRGDGAAARAQPRRRGGDGPHQRCHPLRRARAPERARQR